MRNHIQPTQMASLSTRTAFKPTHLVKSLLAMAVVLLMVVRVSPAQTAAGPPRDTSPAEKDVLSQATSTVTADGRFVVVVREKVQLSVGKEVVGIRRIPGFDVQTQSRGGCR